MTPRKSLALIKYITLLLIAIQSGYVFACPDGYSKNFLGACMPNFGSGGAIDPGRAAREAFVEANAPILKNMILASRQEALGRGTNSLPPEIIQMFSGFYAPNVLSVQWGLGGGNDLSLQSNAFRFGDRNAIVLDTVIVFRNLEDARVNEDNLWLWAHELAHVEQYRSWGIDDFTKRYLRDFQAVESAANERANQFLTFHASRSSPPPNPWPAPNQGGTVCVTPVNSCGWIGPIGWNCICASPWGIQNGVIR